MTSKVTEGKLLKSKLMCCVTGWILKISYSHVLDGVFGGFSESILLAQRFVPVPHVSELCTRSDWFHGVLRSQLAQAFSKSQQTPACIPGELNPCRQLDEHWVCAHSSVTHTGTPMHAVGTEVPMANTAPFWVSHIWADQQLPSVGLFTLLQSYSFILWGRSSYKHQQKRYGEHGAV